MLFESLRVGANLVDFGVYRMHLCRRQRQSRSRSQQRVLLEIVVSVRRQMKKGQTVALVANKVKNLSL